MGIKYNDYQSTATTKRKNVKCSNYENRGIIAVAICPAAGKGLKKQLDARQSDIFMDLKEMLWPSLSKVSYLCSDLPYDWEKESGFAAN